MTNAELIAILSGMPQHIEAVVYNLNKESVHRIQGAHVVLTKGVVAINIVNRNYEPGYQTTISKLGDSDTPAGREREKDWNEAIGIIEPGPRT